jgi:hypothetical protein
MVSNVTPLSKQAVWISFVLTALPSAAYLAWLALVQVNFLYPMWHELIGIDRTIEIYAPQNRYRHGFEQTTKAERSRLFARIVDAIQDQGHGLHALVYQDAAGRPLGKLLRAPEIIHLQDVARLVDQLRTGSIATLIMSSLLLILIRWKRLSMPAAKSLLIWTLTPLMALTAMVLMLGPTEVFYRLHTLVFPPRHQWFFYYQDSLISTMMQAPDLFGYIAAVWAALSMVVLASLLNLGRRAGGSN